MKKWIIGAPDPAAVSTLQKGSDLSELCCAVLASQGCTSLEQASDRIGCRELSDPSLICDMQTAAEAILQAAESGKRICIYGDYDCDGVMATVILYSFLYETGADVTWRIPERAEGYGLNLQAVEEMHQDGVQLVVTVDNGISAIPEAKRMQGETAAASGGSFPKSPNRPEISPGGKTVSSFTMKQYSPRTFLRARLLFSEKPLT